jgi:hypothetical protein
VLVLVTETTPVRAAVSEEFARRSWAGPGFLDAAASAGARRMA